MRCENVTPLLILADEGTLNSLATWRLRRHLAACPACAAERAQFSQLDTHLRIDDPGAVFVSARSQREHNHYRAKHHLRRRLVLAGASAAAMAAFGAVVVLAPGQNAFAQVQQAMANVRTAEWTETETWFIRDAGSEASDLVTKTHVRARLNPPALLLEGVGQHKQGDDRFTAVSLKTPDGFRSYHSQFHEITFQNYGRPNVSREGVAAGLRQEILGKLQFALPEAESKQDWETQQVVLDGKPATQFSIRGVSKSSNGERYTFTLWADPTTKRVLRIVDETRDAATGALTHLKVTEDIRCDVPVPDTAFTLGAPAGMPVYHYNAQWKSSQWDHSSTATLTTGEMAQVNHLMDETYAGILASDWKRTAAGWDLGYAAALPGSPVPKGGLEQWLRRKVSDGRQYKVMRRISVSGINDAPYTRVLGFGDATVPEGTPHLVAVSLTPGILYRDGLQEGGAETFYFRRDGKEGFRIVGWQYEEGDRKQRRRQWLEKLGKQKGHTK